ncbi:hypothetical protein [Salinactinospora qingdaonensis]|uniref:Uncharacterized protein n=1 Tax=Salinactinospora qingdaonensis TaxID=702744 RepID=A0ABP7F4E9_9ACTN
MRLLSALGMLAVLCVLLLSALIPPAPTPRAYPPHTHGRRRVVARQARRVPVCVRDRAPVELLALLPARYESGEPAPRRPRPYVDRPHLKARAQGRALFPASPSASTPVAMAVAEFAEGVAR